MINAGSTGKENSVVEYIELDSSTEKSIGPYRKPAWLIWSQDERGLVSLRGIYTEQWIVDLYRKAIGNHKGIVRVWVEKTITNHLFGEMSFEADRYPSLELRRQTGFDV